MSIAKPTVIIAGASGQLGSALAARAPGAYRIVATRRADMDVTDALQVREVVEPLAPEWIINASAYTAVDAAEDDSATAYSVNHDGASNLAEAAWRVGARMVHVSTDFVFDGRAATPYAPGDETGPLGVYGASKLAGEQAVRERLGNAALVVRTAWLYAPGGRNFVDAMLRLMGERDELRVVADQVGTPTAADGLAAAIWRAVERGVTGDHHWTDAGVASWHDFAVAIRDEALALGLLHRRVPIHPITSAEFPTRARRPAYSVLDKAGFQRALDLQPDHWRDALRRVLTQRAAGDPGVAVRRGAARV